MKKYSIAQTQSGTQDLNTMTVSTLAASSARKLAYIDATNADAYGTYCFIAALEKLPIGILISCKPYIKITEKVIWKIATNGPEQPLAMRYLFASSIVLDVRE